jgi:hypothetical protein
MTLVSAPEQSEFVSLANVKEMQLVVALCALVLPVAEDVVSRIHLQSLLFSHVKPPAEPIRIWGHPYCDLETGGALHEL